MASDSSARTAELAAFLRARRARVEPETVGLSSAGGRRRVTGLRREEIANLAGISYSWYTRLEQGRALHATVEVMDSIARALNLADDEHRHLRRLAGLPLQEHEHDERATESTRLLLEQLLPAPAYVIGPRFDYQGWNDALRVLFTDVAALPAPKRNVLWATFVVPEVRTSLVDWEAHARAVMGQFRSEAAAHPADSRFSAIAAQVAQVSDEFRRWWPTHDVVRSATGTQAFCHAKVGLVHTELVQLRLMDRPTLKVIAHLPATAVDAEKLRQIRSSSDWRAVLG